jgi:hypothetical protein
MAAYVGLDPVKDIHWVRSAPESPESQAPSRDYPSMTTTLSIRSTSRMSGWSNDST